MASIMYFTKAPKYQNILMNNKYETVSRKDIELIESFLNWERSREEGLTSAATFKDWGNRTREELPHKYIISFYSDYYNIKPTYIEYVGETERWSIFEFLGRIAKANAITSWFVTNIMDSNITEEYYEITKENLEDLLAKCNQVKTHFIPIAEKGILNEDQYIVDEHIAKEILPCTADWGYFGPLSYGEVYTNKINETIDLIHHILSTTDFERETVYFNMIITMM